MCNRTEMLLECLVVYNATPLQLSMRHVQRSACRIVDNARLLQKGGSDVGAENLFDFRQTRLINNPENPIGNLFDASMVWGPVIGRMVYGGLRFTPRKSF